MTDDVRDDAEANDRENGAGTDEGGDDLRENRGHRFDRLPATASDREVAGRATREAVVAFWEDRYGVPPEVFEPFTFWEKGAGKVWALHEDVAGRLAAPVAVEALGMTFLRTRQEHWKPTTDAAQRFGRHATDNVVELTDEQARRFFDGADQKLDWDGDWGYLVAAREVAGEFEPVGVGLYLHGELRSVVPKGRQRRL